MAYRLVALLSIAAPVLSLSSHSPVDLESHPAYVVSFNEHSPILNETALELLHEPLETFPHSLLPPRRHLLRTPSGQGFLCTVPSVTLSSQQSAQQRAELDESTRQLERQRGLERGLKLLEPMRGGCIYLKQNWFTYSFCYGSEIRQFHALQVSGSPIPKEDPSTESYVLGHSPEPSIYSSTPKYGSGSLQVAKREALIPSTLGGGEGVALGDGGRYLVQTWEGGSTCDKTGLPRTVEVQFHCNTQTIDRIALIRETSICRYVLLIHTPRLCAEPLFLEGADKSSEPASRIECQPVVSKLPDPNHQQQGDVKALDEVEGNEAENKQEQGEGGGEDQAQNEMGADSTNEMKEEPLVAAPPPDQGIDETETEHDYVDATMMLVYNPETGEIESVETRLDDSLTVAAAGGGNEELRRRVFGGDTREGESEKPKEEEEEEKHRVKVDKLEDMVRMMTESLTKAMEDSHRPSPPNHEDPSSPPPPPNSDSNSDSADGKPQLDVMKLLKEVWGVDASSGGTLTSEQFEKLSKAQAQRNVRERNNVEPVKNEAFEQMRRGFERRYEEEEQKEEEEGKGRLKDEL
ncbi:PRKCSH domain-containing protein [Sporobolomyces salmoneus]|uniref:PRKCSH domain-containing protein n=1 Tax=Sporobolomyces salmoneus TaxID=183962 RepID=UPI003177C7F4